MREIPAGEELTHDWAMTDDDDYSVQCKCGAPKCREVLTGKDWQRPELQKRYAGYFSAYLADKIARQAMLESGMKKILLTSLIAAAALTGMAGCAQIKKPATQARAVPVGLRFDQVGRVALYAGEPCASQIMFDFRGAGSTVSLAAPRNETEILTDAARKNLGVHVRGKWRRGAQSKCSYVEVTSAEITR